MLVVIRFYFYFIQDGETQERRLSSSTCSAIAQVTKIRPHSATSSHGSRRNSHANLQRRPQTSVHPPPAGLTGDPSDDSPSDHHQQREGQKRSRDLAAAAWSVTELSPQDYSDDDLDESASQTGRSTGWKLIWKMKILS